MAKIKT